MSRNVVQCDHIGRFFKFHGDNFFHKSSENIWWHFGLFWNTNTFYWAIIKKNLGHFLIRHMVKLYYSYIDWYYFSMVK